MQKIKSIYSRALFFVLVLISGLAFCTSQVGDEQKKSLTAYTVKSPYLLQPRRNIEYIKSSADFWKKSYDRKYSGYYTLVGRNGIPIKDYKPHSNENFKTTLTQTRNAYGFVRAFMVTGNEEYLQYAKYAINFLEEYCYDKKNGGYYTILNKQGKTVDLLFDDNPSECKNKWSFTQHYALLGPAALYDATRDKKIYANLVRDRSLIDTKLWDSREQYQGYYSLADYDWKNPRGKGFTPTLDCVTTHGLSLYLVTHDKRFKSRLLELGRNVIDYILPSAAKRKMGFAEEFDSDWNIGEQSFLFIGHVLKTAWCLGRINLIEQNKDALAGAEKLMHDVYTSGWDHTYGGPFNHGDSVNGAITNMEKNWWTLEQAVNAGLVMHYCTGNKLYLKMADQSLDFFAKYFLDPKFGEAYAVTSRDGSTVISELKGDIWKAGYHTIETGYYAYLYGGLFLQKEDVSLYYKIQPVKFNREIKLTPIAIEDDKLVITKVDLNSKAYRLFDANKRVLQISSGTGGLFKVTYAVK